MLLKTGISDIKGKCKIGEVKKNPSSILNFDREYPNEHSHTKMNTPKFPAVSSEKAWK